MVKQCSMEGCLNLGKIVRGWCSTHYNRWRKYGDPSYTKYLLDATLGEKLDLLTLKDGSGCWRWQASMHNEGYGQLSYKGKAMLAHRASYERFYGAIPKGMWVDHKCHVRDCVNPEHLRLVTPKQNIENIQGVKKSNTSGYSGVIWFKWTGQWRAEVIHNNKTFQLGYFPLYELHVAGYKAMMKRTELFTHNDKDRRELGVELAL